MTTPYRKKLIEVALPLEAINREAARDKSIRQGHPSTLHLWWARRPLAACRAVLFAQLVDDPGSVPEEFPTAPEQEAERTRLHQLIERLVPWAASNDERVLNEARREIARSVARWRADRGEDEAVDARMRWESPTPAEVSRYLAEKAPPVHDPFCGGGSIPLEAQRLGLRAIASDLNPVAVLITKALVEIPPRFAGMEPVNPDWRSKPAAERALRTWKGAEGLAEDVRYYGRWMRDEAEKRIGHLYPKVRVTAEMAADRPDLASYVGRELTVIAWLWARSVACPNPTCGGELPLVGQMWISRSEANPVWLEIVRDGATNRCRFIIATGRGVAPQGTKVGGRKGGFRCPLCGSTANLEQVQREGGCGRMGLALMAVVAVSGKTRVYIPSTLAGMAPAVGDYWRPDYQLPDYSQAIPTARFGAITIADLFTNRQLAALCAFSDLVPEVYARVVQDCALGGGTVCALGQSRDTAAQVYAHAIAVYMTLAVGRLANRSSKFCMWNVGTGMIEQTFAQQGFNKTFDFCEGNPFGSVSGSWLSQLDYIVRVVAASPSVLLGASVRKEDARFAIHDAASAPVIATDPPYYSNIGYADLSDFFYVWFRRSLQSIDTPLFETLLTPKDQEIVALPHRTGGDKEKAKQEFLAGLAACFGHFAATQQPGSVLSVFYSFKQHETDSEGGASSTGWEVMLDGLLKGGFSVTGTWPIRMERIEALKKGKASLASAIVLACRPRSHDAPLSTRSEFVAALKRELPAAVRDLQAASIAPVDLAQSAIGPGMAVFSRYVKVLEPDGSAMTVRTALGLVNQVLDEVLSAEESELDADTRWAITWFTHHGFEPAAYGEADILSKARVTSVDGMVRAGILEARGGKVRLLRRAELPEDWDPVTDQRFTVWEACQHLIKRLEEGGEGSAAELLRRLGAAAEPARELAYRLYQHCERGGQAEEARAYNGLVVAWPRLAALAAGHAAAPAGTGTFDFDADDGEV